MSIEQSSIRPLPIPSPIDRRFLRRAATTFKALADENRLALLLMLDQDCACECAVDDPRARRTLADVGRRLGISMPTVSHHLKQLQRAGLIACTRSGRRVMCAIRLEPLREILAAIGTREPRGTRRSSTRGRT